MKKFVIASALIALLTTSLSIAGTNNGAYKHPQYPHLTLLSVSLPPFTSNADISEFFNWLHKNSTSIKIIKIVGYNSEPFISISGIVQDQKVEFSIPVKEAKNAKVKVLDKISVKNTKDGYILICNDVPIGVVSNYKGTDNFKPK